MKILVTGGAGFIGSHVVDELIRQGHETIVIDNFYKGKKQNINRDATVYCKDILKNTSNIFKKEKPEVVVHAAAQVMLRDSLKDKIYDAKTNILGTINILDQCIKNGVSKIIYTSTGGARVGEPLYFPVDENHPLNPCSPYGISKHTAEHYVQLYEKLYGLESLIFCFGNVYGPRDDPSNGRVIPNFINQMINKQKPTIYGDGGQTRDFIYVLDLAKFIVSSLDKVPKHRLFHLSNGNQISVKEIFTKLKKLTGFEGEANHIEAIKGEVRDIVLDTSLAKKELGWKPRYSLNQGLKETVDYFQKMKNAS